MALTKVGKDGIIGVSNSADANALFIDSSERVGVGATPNATFGSHLYAQGTPAANKPIISAYSTGNSNKAGIGILNDAGNRGIWTDSNDLLFTTSYEGNSTVHMKIDTNGIITKPLQPAFMGKVGAQIANFAVGSAVTVPFSSEIFDQNLDYNTNGTFTAPVTGKYQFNILILINNMDSAASYYQIQFITSNRTYYHTQDARGFDTDILYKNMDIAILADMDVGDTAIVKIYQSTGTQQSDLDAESYFTGFLAC